jgi:hypothetical protein
MSKFAIAHAMKKKMAKGGSVEHCCCDEAEGDNPECAIHCPPLKEAESMDEAPMTKKERAMKAFAEGGSVDPNLAPEAKMNPDMARKLKAIKMPAKGGFAGNTELAKEHEKKRKAFYGDDGNGATFGGNKMADGGYVDEEEASGYSDNMLSRIMKKHGYSEGGMVANSGEDELDMLADGKPNEFDDLALDDHMESKSDGANNGDSLGDHQEDEDRKDIVSRIMRSQKLKDRLPKIR